MQPGQSIQAALDAAPANGRVTVCAGIYAEKLAIRKDGLTLEGRPGAVLDGGLFTGPRYGITIADGVNGFTLSGFEIRNFADPLAPRDISTAIVAIGNSKNVKILNNYIHHNGWAGLSFGRAATDTWLIEGNRFEANPFAHVLFHGAKRVTIQSNVFQSTNHAVLAANAQKATIARNVFDGAGGAGIVLAPAFDLKGWSSLVSVHNNTISGTWSHGVWSLGLQRSSVRDNAISTSGTAMTIGGDPDQVALAGNGAGAIVETKQVQDALGKIQEIAAQTQPQSMEAEEANCKWWNCWLLRIATWFERVLPSASAQAPPNIPPPCEIVVNPQAPSAETNCVQTLQNLLNDLLFASLNPLGGATEKAYFQRLEACRGLGDDCLRSQFFQPDGNPSNGWNVPIVNDPLLGAATLRFVDAGAKRAWEDKAWRSLRDELNQEWTVFVVCRLIVGTQATNCASVPRTFDYGLDVTWSSSEYAQHVSKWRLKLPSDGVHATFNRIHGSDATLFYATSKPHHGESPPAASSLLAPPPVTENPLRVEYTGSATLQCQFTTTSVTPPPATAATITQDCKKPTLLRDILGLDYYWCTKSLTDVLKASLQNETVHESRALEVAAGYWSWGPTCTALPQPYLSNWTSLYNATDLQELGAAHGQYYGAVSAFVREKARLRSENVTMQAFGRHLGMRLVGQALPLQANLANLNASKGFNVTPLSWTGGARSNVQLEKIEVFDRLNGWTQVEVAALPGFTPMKVTIRVNYRALTGDLIQDRLVFVVADEKNPSPSAPVVVTYAGERYANIVAWDRDNRDYAQGFPAGSTRTHQLVLTQAYAGAMATPPPGLAPLGSAIFDLGVKVPAGVNDITSCNTELDTAKSLGDAENLVGVNYLAIQNRTEVVCKVLSVIQSINLRLFGHLLTTVVVRENLSLPVDQVRAFYEIIGEPLVHLVNQAEPNKVYTIEEALTKYAPTLLEEAVRLGHIRLIIEVPPLPPFVKAFVVQLLLHALAPTVGVFAILLDEVPLTPELDWTIRDLVQQYGPTILMSAGVLPTEARAWAVQDKLMTIKGMSAHPSVLTIGVGSKSGGVAPWSRLGPTSGLTPKPDFVAPSPSYSAFGAVWNVLPYAEAVVLRGVHHPDLTRAVLASFAVPVRSPSGAQAIYWEQGLGAIDPGAFLSLPGTAQQLINVIASLTNQPSAKLLNWTASALKLKESDVLNSASGEIVGAAGALSDGLLRAAVSESLTKVTVDSPAFPRSLTVDFGVVNRERVGTAGFMPLDLDAVLNATAKSYRDLLRSAGYTDQAQLNVTIQRLLDLFAFNAKNGQTVTLNATHYHFFDLFEKDLLYTMYSSLLNATWKDRGKMPPGATKESWAALNQTLSPWAVPPRYLTQQKNGDTTLNVKSGAGCDQIPTEGIRRLVNTTIEILQAEAKALEPSGKSDAAIVFVREKLATIVNMRTFVDSQSRQLLCLQDVIELLQWLKARTEELRAIKATPWGAWNQTEAWLGTWDRTAFGGQIGTTLQKAGVTPGSAAASGSTIVLDKTLELLGRSLDLLGQRLALLRLPWVETDRHFGVRDLSTIPARTMANPLGLYVGLATLTSHDVEVRNPFTNKVVQSRNITIPLPSYLWNNPSLNVDVAFRDTTPIANTTVLMWSDPMQRPPRIIDPAKVTANHTVPQGKSVVPLVVNWQRLMRDEVNETKLHLRLLVDARADLNQSSNQLPPMFKSVLHTHFANVQASLRTRLNNLSVEVNASLPSDWPHGRGAGGMALNKIMLSLVSRLTYQYNVTNETGQAILPNLLPGEYRLFEPYAYPSAWKMDQDLALANPGSAGLAGPLTDLDYEVATRVLHREKQLTEHPSAGQAASPTGRLVLPRPTPTSQPLAWALSTTSPVKAQRSLAQAQYHQYSVLSDASAPGQVMKQFVNRGLAPGSLDVAAWLRMESGTAPSFSVVWRLTDGTTQSVAFPSVSAPTPNMWVKVEASLSTTVAPTLQAKQLVQFAVQATGAGRFFIDNVTLRNRDVQLNEVSTPLVNPSFEDPWACAGLGTQCDSIPFVELNNGWYGPFHQFGLNARGVDLLGVSCAYARSFGEKTLTPIGYRGCSAPLLSTEVGAEVSLLVDLGNCVIGAPHTLVEDMKKLCDDFRAAYNATRDACNADTKSLACLALEDFKQLIEIVANVTVALGFSAEVPANGVSVPLFHSPARVVKQAPAEYGFTTSGLLPLAKRVKWNQGLSDAQLTKDINSVLANLTTIVDTKTDLDQVPPPNKSNLNVSQPQAILHRVTDKVEGIDWFHFTPNVGQNITDGTRVGPQVDEARKMINNAADRDAVTAYKTFGVETLGDPERAQAYNEGLAKSVIQKADYLRKGWKANGTVTPDGLNLPSWLGVQQQMSADQCKSASANISGLSPAYFACTQISKLANEAFLDGVGDVDKVQFANALLEQIRQNQGYKDAPKASDRINFTKKILTTAVALSANDPNQNWTRTNDAIRMRMETAAPALGLMIYNTPVPINEYVQVRLDAEILAQNTGLLLVTTANPTVPRLLMEALKNVSAIDLSRLDSVVPKSSLCAVETKTSVVPGTCQSVVPGTNQNISLTYAETVRRVLEGAALREDPLFRIHPIGLPIVTEEEHCSERGQWHHTLLCARGLVVAQPDGYYNYSWSHEFKTKDREGAGFTDPYGKPDLGVDSLWLVLLYFPSTTQSGAMPTQKFVVKDFSVQLSTYIGFGGEGGPGTGDDDRTRNEFKIGVPIRYQSKVEDWKMLYAVPDQAIGPAGAGLNVTFTMPDNPAKKFNAKRADLVLGLSLADFMSQCHDTNAPGFPTETYDRDPRGIPGPDEPPFNSVRHEVLFLAGEDGCVKNDVQSLRPVHRQNHQHPLLLTPYAAMPVEEKKTLDALEYVAHVDDIEKFGGAGKLKLNAVCAQCYPVPRSQPRAPVGALAVAETAVTAAQTVLAAALAESTGVVDEVVWVSDPYLDMDSATPFMGASFLPKKQHGRGGPDMIGRGVHNFVLSYVFFDPTHPPDAPAFIGPAVHNFVLFDEADALALMAGGEDNPERQIQLKDNSTKAKAAVRFVPDRSYASVETLPIRNDTDYRTLVVAHQVKVLDLVEEPEAREVGSPFAEVGEFLVGHGTAGTGLAVRVTAKQKAQVNDWDKLRFLQGHEIVSGINLTVEAFNLGGNKTVGSDCDKVPLFEYVRPYFRCTGYESTWVTVNATAASSPTQCYPQALAFLGNAYGRSVAEVGRLPQRSFYISEPLDEYLLGFYANAAGDPVTATNETVARVALQGQDARNTVDAQTNDFVALLLCIARSGSLDWGLAETATDQTLSKAKAALADAGAGKVVSSAANSQGMLAAQKPLLAQNGEPTRLTTAKLLVPEPLRQSALLAFAGNYLVLYGVEEWSSRVRWGALNVTETSPGGTPTTRTLAAITGTVAGSVNLPVTHGYTYTLELLVIDEFSNRFRDTVAFTSDATPPVVSVSPAQLSAFSNQFAVTFTATDSVTTVTTARVESNNGTGWKPVTTTTTPIANGVSVLANLNTADLAKHDGKKLLLRFVAEDAAKNRNGTQTYSFNVSSEGFARVDQPSTNIAWNQAQGRVDYSIDPIIAGAEAFRRSLPKTWTPSTSFRVTSQWFVGSCSSGAGAAYPLVLDSPTKASKVYVYQSGPCSQNTWLRYQDDGGTIRKSSGFPVQLGNQYRLEASYDASSKRLEMRSAKSDGTTLATMTYKIGSASGDGFTLSRIGVVGGNNGPAGSTGTCWCTPATGWVDEIFTGSEPEVQTTVDVTAPKLDTSKFLEKVALGNVWIIDTSNLKASVAASDATSGLASLGVTLKNVTAATSSTWHPTTTYAAGTQSVSVALSKSKPQLDATYEFVVTATDHVGNTRTFTSERVEIRPRPQVNLADPKPGLPEVGYLRVNGKAFVPGYPSAGVDDVRVRVLADGESQIFNSTTLIPASNATVAADWNATSAAVDHYNVTFEATRHGVTANARVQVQLTSVTQGARDLRDSLRYDFLGGKSEFDKYRVKIPNCYSGLNLTVTTTSGPLANLWRHKTVSNSNLDMGVAVNPMTDPADWENVTESYEKHNVLPGDVFGFSVAHAKPETLYTVQLRYLDPICPDVT